MAEITAARVKELRDKTGAGMMDCKRALTETGGDLEAAVDWLRKKGIAAVTKKSGRVTAEGLVGLAVAGGRGALVEVNSETDFVARNDAFQDFVRTVAGLAVDTGEDLDALKAAAYPDAGRTVEEQLVHLIATIGENMTLRRVRVLDGAGGMLGSYMHNAAAPGLGKIGVLVALSSEADPSGLETLGKQLAMHVAAANPRAVSRDDVDPADLDREREVLKEQARASGKPEAIIEQMVEGRLRKFFEEECLLEQVFVIDGERKVAAVLDEAAKEVGAAVGVAAFARFALGEGVEKRQDDFAAEVAAAAGT